MAVRNVSTMAQFIEAFRSVVTDDTIEILSDLNFDDVYNDFTSTVNMGGGVRANNVTINGNNHAIYNFSTGSITGTSVNLFSCGSSTVTMNNLSFLNCNCGSTVVRLFSVSSSGSLLINNAVIQGRFKNNFFGNSIIIRDSMITLDHCSGKTLTTGTATTSAKWQNCWFRLNKCQYAYNSGAWGYNIDSCYMEGNLSVTSAPTSYTILGNVNDSCINLDMYIENPLPDSIISSSSGASGQSPNIINISKIISPNPMTEQDSTTWVKCVTDEHMKDAEYLANIGFNIVP